MTSQRKDFIAGVILSHLLDREPFLDMKVSLEARLIAEHSGIPEKAIREFMASRTKNKQAP